VIELPEGGAGVVLGDVAGKGMPAALLMALLQGSLRTLLTAGLRGSELAEKLNAHLHANIPSNRLITLFYGEVDGATGRLRYVNAGHNPPFLIRSDGAIENLAPTAVALGVLAESSFAMMETELGVGDRLVLYTDGINEATNPRDEEYGEVRLEAFLRNNRQLEERALIDALIEDVLAFADGIRPRDDMTLLLLGREG
jgi:sigma-B regulation protein RsbU (phosphoserine phosphatase)